MTISEIGQEISQLEENIAHAEKRRAEADKNIRQLTALNICCNDYQAEFDYARTVRKIRLEDFDQILGQVRLVGAYDIVLKELVNGSEYVRAYESMDMAKSDIRQEIERQKQIISECNSQIVDCISSISYLQQQLASAEEEARNAESRVNYR